MTGWEVGYLCVGILAGGSIGAVMMALLAGAARCGVDREG